MASHKLVIKTVQIKIKCSGLALGHFLLADTVTFQPNWYNRLVHGFLTSRVPYVSLALGHSLLHILSGYLDDLFGFAMR